MNNKSWSMLGFLMGQRLRDMRSAAKEPVAYLYNGVRLPPLPEWDSSAYPYAYMWHNAPYTWMGQYYPGLYALILCTEPLSVSPSWDNGLWSEGRIVVGARYDAEEPYTEWETAGIETGTVDRYGFMWSNVTTYKSDGTVFLAASEPVPVYE